MEKIEDYAFAGLTEEEAAALAADDDGAPEERSGTASAAEDELRVDPDPILPIEGPRDVANRMATIRAERDALVERFEDGDITAREYADGLEAVNERRQEIERERLKADIGREAHERAIESQWYSEVERFMATTGRHIAEKGERALQAFDQYVHHVTGDPANARLSDRAQLDKAYRLFQQDLGSGGRGEPSRAAQEDYLAGLRSRDDEHARDAADFEYLDRLADTDPAAYERAVSRLSRDEQDAYGRGW